MSEILGSVQTFVAYSAWRHSINEVAESTDTEMFGWLYREMTAGRTPTGVPAKLLVEWKGTGEFRRGRGLKRVG